MLMTSAEKGTYIFTAVEILKKHGVPLGKTPSQYTALIDSKLNDDSEALNADTTNVLATVVYDTEPDARDAIDRLRK